MLKLPNHQLVPVTVAVEATDSCDPTPVCELTAVTSNEPENGTGDGDTSPDWEITGPLTVNLRAERAGSGSGRVYTLTVDVHGCHGQCGPGHDHRHRPEGEQVRACPPHGLCARAGGAWWAAGGNDRRPLG